MKTESELTHPLLDALRMTMPGAVVFKHADISTSGIPDISCSWGRVAWLEVKATDDAKIRKHLSWGLQLHNCQHLERATGLCWFIIYRDVKGSKTVSIARPSRVRLDRTVEEEEIFQGHAHLAVAEWVRQRLKGS